MLFGLKHEADVFVQLDNWLFLYAWQTVQGIVAVVVNVGEDLGEGADEGFYIIGSIGNQCANIIINSISSISMSIGGLYGQQDTTAFIQQFDSTILDTWK